MAAVKRLLVVSHRPLDQEGGPTARWRAFARYLPEHGWEVEVVSAPVRPSAVEFSADAASARRVAARARVMATAGALASPAFRLAGLRPEATPLSMLWAGRGARIVRERVAAAHPDVVLATAPPAAGLLAARRALTAGGPPFVAELRDLWAGSPAFETRPGALDRVERWALRDAARVVVMSPEAADDVRARHAELADRVVELPNGFEPELLQRRARRREIGDGLITLLHSGTLNAGRPIAPLLGPLGREPYRTRFRLVLHGYLTADIRAQVAHATGANVEMVAPSNWSDAIEHIRAADIGLVSQARAVGDATAIASKVFEYLALGKPVLAITGGGATEALLKRLGAGELCARLDDPASIAAALDRILAGDWPQPLPREVLAPFDRRAQAARLAALLDELVS